jgi:hypothetical protein
MVSSSFVMLPIVMPKLDLGISRRRAANPTLARGWIMFPSCQERVKHPAEQPSGDAKIKSWHNG